MSRDRRQPQPPFATDSELAKNPQFDVMNPQPWEGMTKVEQQEFNARYGRRPSLPALEVPPDFGAGNPKAGLAEGEKPQPFQWTPGLTADDVKTAKMFQPQGRTLFVENGRIMERLADGTEKPFQGGEQ